jgi:hypothetical protein
MMQTKPNQTETTSTDSKSNSDELIKNLVEQLDTLSPEIARHQLQQQGLKPTWKHFLASLYDTKLEKLALFLAADKRMINQLGRFENKKVTPLHVAASRNATAVAKLLLSAGANVNAPNSQDCTPLFEAIYRGLFPFVQLLVQSGAEVNAPNKNGWTPLHLATKNGHLEVAQLLIESGADVNAKSKWEETPVYHAARNDHFEVVHFLIESGALVNTKKDVQETLLYGAARNGHLRACLISFDSIRKKSKNNHLKRSFKFSFTIFPKPSTFF